MTTHSDTRTLPYDARQMYDLVADVEKYPEFLPWCAAARVRKVVPTDYGELMEADLVVLDLASTPAIAQRSASAEDIWEALFPTIMMGDDRAVTGTWVAGERTRVG